jgi:hypothetical protein
MNAIKLAPKVVPIKKLPKVKETNSENLGIVDQTLIATKKDNLGATTGGFLLGGIVPFLTFMVAHHDMQGFLDPKALLVLGGLIFSFYTVNKWGESAFQSKLKAFGFVVLIEGTMVFSKIHWLSIVALIFLIVINGIATGVNLALAKKRK